MTIMSPSPLILWQKTQAGLSIRWEPDSGAELWNCIQELLVGIEGRILLGSQTLKKSLDPGDPSALC